MAALVELIYLIIEILPWWFLALLPITFLNADVIAVAPDWLFPKPQLSEYAEE